MGGIQEDSPNIEFLAQVKLNPKDFPGGSNSPKTFEGEKVRNLPNNPQMDWGPGRKFWSQGTNLLGGFQ